MDIKKNRLRIADFVFGATDGCVTTFAIVAGSIGASLSPAVVLILGFANIFADGLSMAVSNYLATNADRERIARVRKREEWATEHMADEERQEVRDIYAKKGFKEDMLEEIVRIITARRKVWVDTMMREEVGLVEDEGKRPIDAALSSFVGFVSVGLIPLIPFIFMYLLGLNSISEARANALLYSVISAMMAFFLIGVIKGKVVDKPVIRSGTITLLLGGAAATVAYLVGHLLGILAQ
jgi:VIT1/CCC1 family predicted Fe2+/Mn2+ transporter